MPCGVDLECNPQAARRAAAQGLQALPYMAEIYPIGGVLPTLLMHAHSHWCMQGAMDPAHVYHNTIVTSMSIRCWRPPGSHR
jgi:hypothetical protein